MLLLDLVREFEFGFLGFPKGEKLPEEILGKTKTILEDKYFKEYSTETEADEQWVWREIDIDKIKKPLDELTKMIITS